MSRTNHTYGPGCHLERKVSPSSSSTYDEMPDLKAQFFYASPHHIDDVLSAVPAPSGSDSRAIKHPLRPFSAVDNTALEAAWSKLSSAKDKKHHNKGRSTNKLVGKLGLDGSTKVLGKTRDTMDAAGEGNSPPTFKHVTPFTQSRTTKFLQSPKAVGGDQSTPLSTTAANSQTTDSKATELGKTSTSNRPQPRPASPVSSSTKSPEKSKSNSSKQKPVKDAVASGEAGSPKLAEQTDHSKDVSCTDADHDLRPQPSSETDVCGVDGTDERGLHYPTSKKLASSPDLGSKERKAFDSHSTSQAHQNCEQHLKDSHGGEALTSHATCPESSKRAKSRLCESPNQISDSGSIRSQSKKYENVGKARPVTPTGASGSTNSTGGGGETGMTGQPFLKLPSRRGSFQEQSPTTSTDHKEESIKDPKASKKYERDSTEEFEVCGCNAQKNTKGLTEVPVGVSRLHQVCIPELQMKPIYWVPVHDEAPVTRGTWFYKDTMLPVEPAVANQLETGYRELKSWSRTWRDELNSAIDVGAAGEEKIAHRLWPKENGHHGPQILPTDPHCAARCFNGEASAEGIVSDEKPDGKPFGTTTVTKKYPNSQVIYKDAENAFILKPNLQPSEYYGRKPLAKIRRGITVGIAVVRGFDWKAWEKLHPSKVAPIVAKAESNAPTSGDNTKQPSSCPGCRSQEQRPKVTDLCLVIHGIGQELAKSMESFNFTHAINGLRRSVNVEMVNPAIQNVLRDGCGGMTVLPVNWRTNISFNDGGPKNDQSSDFSLKDITMTSIPAVRSIISDVMLDIPFYMSHHKPKMISAVVAEANRVYKLWCQNNPDFDKYGRVHIIAHSLGSVMALEVLSKQPTHAPKPDIQGKRINTKHFDFNTKNLFLAGSPAGFFLLLEKGKLLPRKDRNKDGAEPFADTGNGVAGYAGTFGCLAADNIYNIMHYNDPISYRLNATVDPQWAAGLKDAQVPSATTGVFERLGNAMKSITPGIKTADIPVGQVAQPVMARLPSNMEMEVHDFTAEEIAEKKFSLLNDNGQIDYFLSSGGGPLEIQYLSMIGAHSSYWTSPDFTRMLVMECGRKPGKDSVLPSMKAVKSGNKKTQ